MDCSKLVLKTFPRPRTGEEPGLSNRIAVRGRDEDDGIVATQPRLYPALRTGGKEEQEVPSFRTTAKDVTSEFQVVGEEIRRLTRESACYREPSPAGI
ncbi:hypothetical protein E4U13_006414 [Claviceps humidiphila]|uniref:Uncharacterized protein n=1 Tax=Claviceps humidiphila TaxID=1294629 RepID=A0A9P7TWU6_9HYPO|nr:hypothetical protein E4U13_006414 [Claviceps humidiphila]